MAEHVRNAHAVAELLEADPRVASVNYASLPSSPEVERAARYLPEGAGAVFTFALAAEDGRAAGARFIEALELISHLANVGDARTLVIHPASTTHQQLSAEELERGGVSEEMVRLSIGLEDLDDILWDLDRGLEAATGQGAPHHE